jgi:hypothetical protein
LLLSFAAAEAKPVPKLPVGKETTYFTGPLDKQGYIDYEAALNHRLGKGITPAKNANVLLWKALGPTPEGGKGMPAEFFKRLGMEKPPRGGAYFIDLAAFLLEQRKVEPGQLETFFDQEYRATQQPWTAKDYPHLAAWLQANERPLALVVEAMRRPEYFNPLVTERKEQEPASLIGAFLSGVQKCRQLASALGARAMLRLGEGKYDEAWQDLLACHRLGRLIARGATLIEGLVGIAIDQIATNADLAYVERAGLNAQQIRDRLKDLQILPPMPPAADKIDLGERTLYLDSLQLVRRGGPSVLEGLAGGKAMKPSANETKAMAMIDWEPALRGGNRWYDRLAAALRLKDRAEREKALDQIEEDLKALKKEATSPANLTRLMLMQGKPDKLVGKAIGDVLIGLMMPAARKVQNAHDRADQLQRNLRVAFALAAFQRDHGRYPTRLDELAPKYLPDVPGDLFSGKALVYSHADKGYLLYSVGVNGKDEGGRSFDDDPAGDDLPVRMPLPELKRNR